MLAKATLVKNLPCWQGAPASVRVLKSGATNIKYLVASGRHRYVARFLGRAQARYLKLDRRREVSNTKLAHQLGLGPQVVAHYPKHALLVVVYLPGKALDKRKLNLPRNILAVGKLLRRLHAGGGFRGRFLVASSIAWFERRMQRDGRMLKLSRADEQKRARCLSIIAQRRVHPTRCHIDPMPQNFVTQGSRLKLIDWEYAAMGDPLWDLAFVSAVGRFTLDNDRLLLRAHGTIITLRLWQEFRALRARILPRGLVGVSAAWTFELTL